MDRSTLLGLDPVESLLASREGNFAQVLAFAAARACCCELNDHSPDSTRPTIPAPSRAL
jgi:hypothetical protein